MLNIVPSIEGSNYIDMLLVNLSGFTGIIGNLLFT